MCLTLQKRVIVHDPNYVNLLYNPNPKSKETVTYCNYNHSHRYNETRTLTICSIKYQVNNKYINKIRRTIYNI